MTQPTSPHNVDVSIRALIMNAAQLRLRGIRAAEQETNGVPRTTLADVGRAILENWSPDKTATSDQDGQRFDNAGNKITTRGHRKFPVSDALPPVPNRPADQPDDIRAARLVELMLDASTAGTVLAVTALNQLIRVMKHERLEEVAVDGIETRKWATRARRALLKPFRFPMSESTYQSTVARLKVNNTTVTRALEVGLEEFARTGKLQGEN